MRRLCVDGRTKHPSFGDSPGGSNHSDWVQAWKILVDLSVQCARWGNQGSGTWLGQGGTYLQTAFSPPSGIHARSWGLAALSYAPPYPHTKLTGNEVVSNLNSVVKDRNSTQIANIHWVIEKAREFQKTSTSASLTTLMSQLIRNDPDAGNDWSQEKGMTEDEMVGWLHRLNGREFEQAPGDDEGHLSCCSPWGRKE